MQAAVSLSIFGTDSEPSWGGIVSSVPALPGWSRKCCAHGHGSPEGAAACAAMVATSWLSAWARHDSCPGTAGGAAIATLEAHGEPAWPVPLAVRVLGYLPGRRRKSHPGRPSVLATSRFRPAVAGVARAVFDRLPPGTYVSSAEVVDAAGDRVWAEAVRKVVREGSSVMVASPVAGGMEVSLT